MLFFIKLVQIRSKSRLDREGTVAKDATVQKEYLVKGYGIDQKKMIRGLKDKFGGNSLFGNEKDESFQGSLAAIYQSFGGKDLYPSVEEKASNLLYFVIKNHANLRRRI